jgi:hypothetical protein
MKIVVAGGAFFGAEVGVEMKNASTANRQTAYC